MRASHYALSVLVIGLAAFTPTAFADESCAALFDRSAGLSPILSEAYTAMKAKTDADYAKVLPPMEKALSALPASEIKAELCDGNHINAYTEHQYAELLALKAHGYSTGFPADVPIVKQPDLNQANLAYSVGWIKYEQKNFEAARAAYAKGLAMFPHNTSLQQENLAVLMQLARYDDVTSYAEKILSDGTAMDDSMRAKTYSAYALAKFSLGDLKMADDMMGVSLKYADTPESNTLQQKIRDAIAKKT